jgi:hypothetical protein
MERKGIAWIGFREGADAVAAIVPAQPGWKIVEPGEDAQGFERFYTGDIVAWAILQNCEVEPLTCDGPQRDREYVMLEPGGQVVLPGVEKWDNLDEFRAHLTRTGGKI